MNLECTESRKYFQAQPPRRRKFQFRLFLSSLDVFGCVLCRRPFANIAVYFIRRGVDTDTQDRNKEKFPALKGILKSQKKKKKNILFKLLDLKMKFTQLLHEHFFFFFFVLCQFYLIAIAKKILKNPSSLLSPSPCIN